MKYILTDELLEYYADEYVKRSVEMPTFGKVMTFEKYLEILFNPHIPFSVD